MPFVDQTDAPGQLLEDGKSQINRRLAELGTSLHLVESSPAVAKLAEFAPQLVQHPHEQVGQRLVVLSIERNVPAVSEPTADQDNRQVLAGVRGAVGSLPQKVIV